MQKWSKYLPVSIALPNSMAQGHKGCCWIGKFFHECNACPPSIFPCWRIKTWTYWGTKLSRLKKTMEYNKNVIWYLPEGIQDLFGVKLVLRKERNKVLNFNLKNAFFFKMKEACKWIYGLELKDLVLRQKERCSKRLKGWDALFGFRPKTCLFIGLPKPEIEWKKADLLNIGHCTVEQVWLHTYFYLSHYSWLTFFTCGDEQ